MTTPKLQMPELAVGQAGKELTHNQALAVLDQLAQAVVVDKDLTAPPGSPANGAMYIVAAGATGAWSGQSGKLAYRIATVAAWTFITPADGWSVWVADEAERYERKAGAWVVAVTAGRELLTSPRTYYVRTDGNDSNTGLLDTAGGAFLTIQKAVDVVSTLDIGVFNVTISVESSGGGYDVGRGVKLKSLVGSGVVTIRGNGSSPVDTKIFSSGSLLPTEAVFFASGIAGSWRITNVGIYSVGSGATVGIQASSGSRLTAGDIDCGAGFITAQLRAIDSGVLELDSNYSISSGAGSSISAVGSSVVRIQNITVTLVGTPSFTVFCSATQCGAIVVTGNTFIGTATGQRYLANLNGVINTGGAGASYFPGDTIGAITSGGQYV